MQQLTRISDEAIEIGDFLTDQQLADLVGVTPRTTLRWRRDGGGPAFTRAGHRRVLYLRSDVMTWLASNSYKTLAAETAARRGRRE